MSEPRRLDLDAWPRRAHFELFRTYEHPFFNVCAEVDVSAAVRRCRASGGPSFFLATFHASLGAANDVAELRYRIRGDGVVVHNVVHGGSTVLLSDERFAFGYFDYDPDFDAFARSAGAVLAEVLAAGGPLDPRDDRDDLLHYSVLPWIAFTSFAHARRHRTDDSVPKVVFGRRHGPAGAERMPVSVEVHHALADGIHVARFYERFQARLDAFGSGPPAA